MARATDFTKMTTSRNFEKQCGRVNECLYLVKFKGVEQIVQLPILAHFFELDVMLLQTMKCQLCLVINKNFKGL